MLNNKTTTFYDQIHPPHQSREVKSFWHWLHESEPSWIRNLDYVNDYLYHEIQMNRQQLEWYLRKLEEYGVLVRED